MNDYDVIVIAHGAQRQNRDICRVASQAIAYAIEQPSKLEIVFEGVNQISTFSEISTSKNSCRVVDSFSTQSYNRFAKAFESSESS